MSRVRVYVCATKDARTVSPARPLGERKGGPLFARDESGIAGANLGSGEARLADRHRSSELESDFAHWENRIHTCGAPESANVP